VVHALLPIVAFFGKIRHCNKKTPTGQVALAFEVIKFFFNLQLIFYGQMVVLK